MPEDGSESLKGRLESLILRELHKEDAQVKVISRLREDQKIDVTVISTLFEGRDGQARESLFWRVFAETPKSELIYMTYALMMTPDEAKQFSASCMNPNPLPADAWEE